MVVVTVSAIEVNVYGLSAYALGDVMRPFLATYFGTMFGVSILALLGFITRDD